MLSVATTTAANKTQPTISIVVMALALQIVDVVVRPRERFKLFVPSKMSVPDRRAKLDRAHGVLSIRHQCRLLGLSCSGVYRTPQPANDDDLTLMRQIDELFTARPFLGLRRMAWLLSEDGVPINRKRVQRLVRKMGIEAVPALSNVHLQARGTGWSGPGANVRATSNGGGLSLAKSGPTRAPRVPAAEEARSISDGRTSSDQ
ncbi:IS3 family transposase [Bradyrhizobium sp. DASA03120]|uniref:IS3 family transposase n=1 Tax=Bradyrhizobium sp. SMVTL-02 TaxID=3395917 RepID=UPI003F6F22DF